MIKDNQKYFNGLHVFLDALAIAGSYILAWYLKFEGPLLVVFTKIARINNNGERIIRPQAEPTISTVLFAILFTVLVNGTYRILITERPLISSV